MLTNVYKPGLTYCLCIFISESLQMVSAVRDSNKRDFTGYETEQKTGENDFSC